jgi:hypothetical protein
MVSNCCIPCVKALVIIAVDFDLYVRRCDLFNVTYFVKPYGCVGLVEFHLCIIVGIFSVFDTDCRCLALCIGWY